MAPLIDPERLAAYRDALSNWRFQGYVQFDLSEAAIRWVQRELDSQTFDDIKRLMFDLVDGGGVIDEVRETRPEWNSEYPYHYDLRFSIQGKPVYIETRLIYRRPVVPDEPWILVVSIHAP